MSTVETDGSICIILYYGERGQPSYPPSQFGDAKWCWSDIVFRILSSDAYQSSLIG
jgi:hypothetical protein